MSQSSSDGNVLYLNNNIRVRHVRVVFLEPKIPSLNNIDFNREFLFLHLRKKPREY